MSEYSERMQRQPWRRWYKTAQWQRLRTIVLARDPICRLCNRYPSTVADHIKPHKGTWQRFVDLDNNLAGVCKPCHDKKTATQDGGFGRAPKVDGKPKQYSVESDVFEAALADLADIAALDV